jgi:hypothetical protein
MAKFVKSVEVGTTKHGHPRMRRVVECDHCGTHVLCDDGWANACSGCGTEYNGFGQRLNPRHMWGEETGEQF